MLVAVLAVVRGDHLIADTGNHRVQLCPATFPGFPCRTVAGMLGPGSDANQLNTPWDVVVTAEGDNVIADYFNTRIQLCPAASAGSHCGTLQVVSLVTRTFLRGVWRSTRIVFSVVTQACATSLAGGAVGSGDTQLSNPAGVLIDAAGDYVIADRNNHRIQLCSGSSPGSPCVTVGTGTAGSVSTELPLRHRVDARRRLCGR